MISETMWRTETVFSKPEAGLCLRFNEEWLMMDEWMIHFVGSVRIFKFGWNETDLTHGPLEYYLHVVLKRSGRLPT